MSGYSGGHDLTLSRVDNDILWLTTNQGVLRYRKSSDVMTGNYSGHETLNKPHVKAYACSAVRRQRRC